MLNLLEDYISHSLPEQSEFETNPNLLKKVSPEGEFLSFYGNTVVFLLEDRTKEILSALQSQLYMEAGEMLSQPLHPDTFHMTLHDLVNGTEPTADLCRKMEETKQQFEHVIAQCRDLFAKKLHDYGPSWRILRPSSLTDQLFIKAKRIRSLEVKKESLVGEGIRPEFIGLINYGIIGLIQLDKGFADTPDMSAGDAMALYDRYAGDALQLMLRKNHDYDEAWRSMRVSSYTDFILTKIQRVKEIEDLGGATLVSEGIDANYMDIINYAVFGVIKLTFG